MAKPEEVENSPPATSGSGDKADAGTNPLTKAERAKAVMDDPNPVIHSNYVPAQLHRHLEFIDFNSDGHMILGCSDLTGRIWAGSLWYYRRPDEPPSVEKALTGIDLDQSVVDGRFVADNRILVGLDNGAVEQVTLVFSDESDVEGQSFFFLERQYAVQEHDDLITGLDLTKDPESGSTGNDAGMIVTVSYDRSIVGLDLATLRLETRISGAHNNVISAVSCNRVSGTVATAAQEGTVQLWDLKTSACQSRIYNNSSDWPTAVEWVHGSEHQILVGCQTGKVLLVDARNHSQPLSAEPAFFGSPVHKFKFDNSAKLSSSRCRFAVSGDSPEVKTFQIKEGSLAKQYSDSRHTDYVRGLGWRAERLYSCGWDHKVITHQPPST